MGNLYGKPHKNNFAQQRVNQAMYMWERWDTERRNWFIVIALLSKCGTRILQLGKSYLDQSHQKIQWWISLKKPVDNSMFTVYLRGGMFNSFFKDIWRTYVFSYFRRLTSGLELSASNASDKRSSLLLLHEFFYIANPHSMKVESTSDCTGLSFLIDVDGNNASHFLSWN